MKIICDNCRTKYSIADEKVQGKVFKIRCKKCQNIIVVRGNQGGTEEAAPGPEAELGNAAETKDPPVWHLVVGREQVGPMTAAEVRERFSRGEIDTESYIWREGFADWQRLTSVPEFGDLAQATAVARAGDYPDAGGAAAAWSAADQGGAAGAAWGQAPAAASPAWDAGGGEQAWSTTEDTARADSAGLFGGSLPESGRDLFSSQHGEPANEPMAGYPGPGGGAPAGGLFGAGLAAEPAGDLFGGGASASPAPAGGNGGQQAFPAAAADPRVGAVGGGEGGVQMTGARHENSVLFSLSNLQALAMGGKPSPSSSAASSGDGSGLIDIRSMAFPAASPASGGGVDELPDLGGFSPPIAAAPVLMPSLVEERPKWILPTVIGLGGLLVVTLVVLVVVLAFRKPEPVTVAATLPMPGTSQVQPAPPKVPEKPAVTADTKEPEKVAENKTGGEEAKPGKRPVKGGKRPGRGGKGAKGPVAVAKADPEPSAQAGRPARKASRGDDLDALIDGAISGGKKPAPRKVAAAAPAGGGGANLPDTLSRAEIQGGMRKIKDRVQGCYDKFRVPGTAFVQVTIAPSGTISAAKVKGMFAGTPTGACLQAAARAATFPRFKGQPITIDYPFILR